MTGSKNVKTRRSEPKQRRHVDSMAAATAASGMRMEEVKACKSAGCPAFRGSRVYLDELDEWVKKNGIPQSIDPSKEADARISKVTADRKEFEFAVLQKRYIKRDECERVLMRGVAEMKKSLFSMANSLPPQLSGLSLQEMQGRLEQGIIDALNHAAEIEWPT